MRRMLTSTLVLLTVLAVVSFSPKRFATMIYEAQVQSDWSQHKGHYWLSLTDAAFGCGNDSGNADGSAEGGGSDGAY